VQVAQDLEGRAAVVTGAAGGIAAVERFGRLDAIIPNAGFRHVSPVGEFPETLALEGAAAGITATAVCPAFVRTPLVEAQIASQAKAHGLPADRVLEEVILAPHAIKRLIEPDEVAQVVSFLLGPGGGAFSGAPVTMDLGWSAR
jgi:NAD(P)-dependent dehydrogenase (short-subunit alcohol dehydrogenase family)